MENHPIVLEKLLNAPVSKVWKALTDINEMGKWYFQLEDFKAEVGFKFQFTGGPSPDKQYIHECEVTEAIFESKLTYSWSYKGYAGKSYVSFELFRREEQTLLKLMHSGLETFPKDNKDFAIQNFQEGWNEIINTSLKNHVEGDKPSHVL